MRLAIAPLLLALAACPSGNDFPETSDVGQPRDAAMPYRLESTVFGNHLSLERGWLRRSIQCPRPDAGQPPDGGARHDAGPPPEDAGCYTSVVALVFATLSPCPEDDLDYRSVEVYLTRWTPGTYRVGTADPVTVQFVRREGWYREEHVASEGQVDLTECDLAAGRCLGTIDARSASGDTALGTLAADLACAEP